MEHDEKSIKKNVVIINLIKEIRSDVLFLSFPLETFFIKKKRHEK